MRDPGPISSSISPAPALPAFYAKAELYDRACSWDTRAETEFLHRVTARHGRLDPQRVLEPFCGTGRLLSAWPRGFGLDICAPMLRRAHRRARGRVLRADAGAFFLRANSFDFAYCLNDSFRHLLTVDAAKAHLRSVAATLRPGTVYALGFDVTGGQPFDGSCESWDFLVDDRTWRCSVRSLGDTNPETGLETVWIRTAPGSPGAGPEHAGSEHAGSEHAGSEHAGSEHAGSGGEANATDDFFPMRSYTRRDVEDLIDDEGSFELAAVYDGYERSATPIELSEVECSAILVLRKEEA